jgi:vacuolar-type H+-ATPase subunit I/STV1
MTAEVDTQHEQLRQRAINRLKKRHDFHGHLLTYTLVNSFFVIIWAVTSRSGFFWPVFPMVGWGIGVVMNAWDVYRDDELDETRIREEIERLKK